ncbi:hypothetical protein ACFQ0M_07865 [Kitasatospora aburaviensis]
MVLEGENGRLVMGHRLGDAVRSLGSVWVRGPVWRAVGPAHQIVGICAQGLRGFLQRFLRSPATQRQAQSVQQSRKSIGEQGQRWPELGGADADRKGFAVLDGNEGDPAA